MSFWKYKARKKREKTGIIYHIITPLLSIGLGIGITMKSSSVFLGIISTTTAAAALLLLWKLYINILAEKMEASE